MGLRCSTSCASTPSMSLAFRSTTSMASAGRAPCWRPRAWGGNSFLAMPLLAARAVRVASAS
eukprot:15341809-Alexandrium_andersonii.AAC.1